MDENPFTDEDLRGLCNLVQEEALRCYPNPERKNCPAQEAIREMAELPLPARHSLYHAHVARCSPCLREMLERRTHVLGNCAPERPPSSGSEQ